jgi:hypothetical protein
MMWDKDLVVHLCICVVSQAEAARADVSHRWAPQNPDNLGRAAPIVGHW